ncbi:hypothetical protein PMI09_03277 [Rhizobium sp. CF122]|nr:hypothetical protein PMI09_03277 [Rhizobium sp. CF122]
MPLFSRHRLENRQSAGEKLVRVLTDLVGGTDLLDVTGFENDDAIASVIPSAWSSVTSMIAVPTARCSRLISVRVVARQLR